MTVGTTNAGSCVADRKREWTITTTSGVTVSGYLPRWAQEDPSEVDVPPEELAARLADITHHVDFPGQMLDSYSPGNPTSHDAPLEILRSSIDCNPYATGSDPRCPVVNIRIAGEFWLTDLGPKEVAGLVAKLRTLADRLDRDIIPTLDNARSDWTNRPMTSTGGRS